MRLTWGSAVKSVGTHQIDDGLSNGGTDRVMQGTLVQIQPGAKLFPLYSAQNWSTHQIDNRLSNGDEKVHPNDLFNGSLVQIPMAPSSSGVGVCRKKCRYPPNRRRPFQWWYSTCRTMVVSSNLSRCETFLNVFISKLEYPPNRQRAFEW